MFMCRLHFIFFLLLSAVTIAQRPYYEYFGVQQGIGQSQVPKMVQDHNGFVWMATKGGGLSRFDGKNFKSFRKSDGLQSNDISDMVIIEDQLYLATGRGIDALNLNKLSIQNVLSTEMSATKICSDQKGGFYFKQGGGKYFHFSEGQLIELPKLEGTELTFFETDENGDLYFSDMFGNLYRWTGKNYFKIAFVPKEEGFLYFLFHDGFLYAGVNGKMYRSPSNDFSTPEKLNVPFFYTFDILKNEIWISNFRNSFCFDAKTLHPKYEEWTKAIGNIILSDMLEDQEGGRWLSSDGRGVFHLPGVPVHNYNHLSDIEPVVFNIEEDREGRVWATSFHKGTYVLDNQKLVKTINPSSLTNFEGYRRVLFDDQNRPHYYFRRRGEFVLNNQSNFVLQRSPENLLSDTEVIDMVFSRNGKNQLYLALNGFHYRGEGLSKWYPTEQPATRAVQLNEPDQFAIFTGDSLLFLKDGEVYSIPEAQKLQPGYIMSADYDSLNHRLYWADLESGLYMFDFDEKKQYVFDTKQGLSSSLIYCLTLDSKQNIWIGTERGVQRVTLSSENQIIKTQDYAKEQGFFGIETNSNSLIADSHDNIWIGSVGGLFVLLDSLNEDNPHFFPPFLEAAGFLFDTTAIGPYQKTDLWDLPYQKRSLQLKFSLPAMKNPGRAKILYQWDEEGTSWEQLPESGDLLLNNIGIGNHTLRLRNSLDTNEQKVLLVNIRVNPPWWGSWWFIAFMTAAIILFIYQLQKYFSNKKLRKEIELRELREEAENEIRTQLGQDFHDEVGNRLASITTQTGVLSLKMKEAPSDEKAVLSQIQQNARKLYSDTKDFIWTINPESSRFSEIVIYIKDVGEKLFEYSPMNFLCESELTTEMEKTTLPSGQSMQLIMIFKEAMTNVVKHSEATKVTLSFGMVGENWNIELKDNGIGFEETGEVNGHFGLGNMKDRADKIQAKLTIASKKNIGTSIRLSNS